METEKKLTESIWRWFSFKKESSICFVSADTVLNDRFDYIIVLDFSSLKGENSEILKNLRSHLKFGGTLLLGFDNSLAYRFFCGDTKIEGKQYFTKHEIKNLLASAEIKSYKFYSVFPCLEAAQLIYADTFTPAENLNIRFLPLYNNPDSVFKFEESGYDDLIQNGLFHSMANAFLVECNDEGVFNNALQITLSADRGNDMSYATIIRENDTVIKKPLFSNGTKKLEVLQKNLFDIKKLGLNVVEGSLNYDEFSMPFVNAPLGNVYLQELAQKDRDSFIKKMDHFRELIYKSAENGICYFDLVPLNSFYVDGDFSFFDQEFDLPASDYPPEMLVYRTIVIVYSDFEKMNAIAPIDFFWKRYGIQDKLPELEKLSHEFLMSLRNQEQLKSFNALHQRKDAVVRFNMAQRNQTHFYDSLLNRNFIEGTFGKKVCVFGSGRFAEKFISQYGDNCDVVQVVDNDSSKWNSDFHGIKISSPSTLSNISDDICLVICVKDYKPIYNQLLSINIKNIVLYDAHKNYSVGDLKDGENKKYHVGYLSGVFDLYHIGHINMFRRAKEMCDYLIVGVTSDEYVLNKKKKTPFIPCEERMQVIQACKYVDKVVKVPYLHEEITEAWNTYHYDVQFCGSDYENNPWWLEQQKWLREHGADLVFFPYTEQTNSTKIKALIEKGLL